MRSEAAGAQQAGLQRWVRTVDFALGPVGAAAGMQWGGGSLRRRAGVNNSITHSIERREESTKNSPRVWKSREGSLWNIPGNDCRPRMISRRRSCSETRSSDIIRPNITREMNWLV